MHQLATSIEKINWEDETVYIQWLRDSYEYAFNSTRILAHAAGNMPPEYTQFSDRFVKHAAEERGHEKLLEADLKFFNLVSDNVPASVDAKLFHQSLYYWLSQHASPIGLFGWILALEGVACESGNFIFTSCEKAFGPKAVNFIKLHAEADPDHLAKAFASIENLTFSDLRLVEETLVQYTEAYLKVLNSAAKSNNLDLAAS